VEYSFEFRCVEGIAENGLTEKDIVVDFRNGDRRTVPLDTGRVRTFCIICGQYGTLYAVERGSE